MPGMYAKSRASVSTYLEFVPTSLPYIFCGFGWLPTAALDDERTDLIDLQQWGSYQSLPQGSKWPVACYVGGSGQHPSEEPHLWAEHRGIWTEVWPTSVDMGLPAFQLNFCVFNSDLKCHKAITSFSNEQYGPAFRAPYAPPEYLSLIYISYLWSGKRDYMWISCGV